MVIITVFGKGEMGQTIGDLLESDGHQIDYVDREGLQGRALGDVVILALRYDAIAGVVEENKEAFQGRFWWIFPILPTLIPGMNWWYQQEAHLPI